MTEEMLVSITNRRQNTPMDLADGNGGLVHIDPNETKIVRGDYNFFRRAAKDIGGLVVKPAPGGTKKIDHDTTPNRLSSDIHKVRISNYRDIPMRLATGVDRQYVEIPRSQIIEDPVQKGKKKKVPGQAVCIARVSLVKQMTSIKVEILDKDGDKTPVSSKPHKDSHRRNDVPTLKVDSEPEVPKTSEPPADSLESLRKQFELPDTVEGWLERAKAITWHDLRGICGELGFSRPQSRDHAVKLIQEKLYPDPAAADDDEESEEDSEAEGDNEDEKKSSKRSSRKRKGSKSK